MARFDKINQDEHGYNGWSNYPTWCVNLWLSNDEGLYKQAQEMAMRTANAAPNSEMVQRGVFNVHEQARGDLSSRFRDWVTDELAPDLGASFAADLLGYALGEVDWYELAEAWLTDLVEA